MVEAKKEYLGVLCLVMCPPMIEVFQEMYNEAAKLSKGRQVLIMFQKLLREVPNWSNAMSKKHSDNITDRCDHFGILITAVFVACTKILSAVRLKADNKKIVLKVPTEEVFVQTCYNNIAENLYRDPYIFTDEQSEYLRDEKLAVRFTTSIERTVRELIPIQEILRTYMTQSNDSRDIDIDGEIQDGPDPDVYEEIEPMAEPIDEPMMMEDPCVPEPTMQPTGLENEFKTIPGVADPYREEPQEDDVLFGDAPDQRTKKVAYN
jgi:hypothetical protein